MTARESIIDIVRKAYQIEVDGYTFYSMTAERADKPAVRDLFAKLAADEVQHQAFLRSVLTRYDAEGVGAFAMQRRAPEAKELSARIFSERFREQAHGAAFETAVLSIGMQLETRAIAHFSEAARTAPAAEVREFYEFLADWERQHLDALNNLFGLVKTDFWEQAPFSPF